MEHAVSELLRAAGLDPEEGELRETPRRVAELWQREFLSGYAMDPAAILADCVNDPGGGDAVFTFDLAFHGLCPHHLMPFQGHAHVVYLPGGRVVGLGRLGKLVACFTQRLTLQERATREVAEALVAHLGARGAGCVLEANHLCLGIPADRHANNRVVTAAFAGALDDRPELRARLLAGSQSP